MNKRIAFFDFDGTITTKDTLLEFIRFCKGDFSFLRGFLWNSPYLIAFKLRLISNQLAKEKVLQYFFRNTPVDEFQKQCGLFKHQRLPGLIRSKALDEIRILKEKGTDIVVVSASPENWIKEWAGEMNLHLIASRLEIKDGKITGKITGKNCHGQEKVRRILEAYRLHEYTEVSAYGDSAGDRPMLELAGSCYFKPFRN